MNRGRIVLTPFPFTDLSRQKNRPALIVSRTDHSDPDVMIAFIGSYNNASVKASEILVDYTHPDFSKTGLKRSSVIKLHKLTTVERSVLLGELGEISDSLVQQVNEKLRYALDL